MRGTCRENKSTLCHSLAHFYHHKLCFSQHQVSLCFLIMILDIR
jgi:hypothetical protein